MMDVQENGKTISDIEARYVRAQSINAGLMEKEKKMALNTTLYPHWINDECFWYEHELHKGKQYRLVNTLDRSNEPAFDHVRLANVLAEKTVDPIFAENLPLGSVEISLSPLRVSFFFLDQYWVYSEDEGLCQSKDIYPYDWLISPDGNKALFVRNYNLWVLDLVTKEEKALTHDGERFYAYASRSTAKGVTPSGEIEAQWSPDSKRIFTQVIDSREVEVAPPLIDYTPADGSLRPIIMDENRRLGFPGDRHNEISKFLAIEVDSEVIIVSEHDPSPTYYPLYYGEFTGHRAWWNDDSRHCYFIHYEAKGLTLVRFDTHTGKTQDWIKETSDTYVRLLPVSHMTSLIYPLSKTDELIWYSERSGWFHIYLYDLSTGKLKNSITSGDWLVRNVLHYDDRRRELYIQTAGRIKGRNPYYKDICRVNIDTSELIEVLSSDHEYVVADQRSMHSLDSTSPVPFTIDYSIKGVSPNGEYVVTTRSRVDQIPVSLLLNRDGKEILTIETADISGLPKGWQWPESVKLASADGTVDIWGTVYRPSNFSPDKSYPILDCSFYASSPIGSFTNIPSGDHFYLARAAYAELGFIVVDIDNRGNNGLRERAFRDYIDPLFPINPKGKNKHNSSDKVAGIKQLAKKYSYMDLNRVGVVDFGVAPMALNGLLVHPHFYKVGVSHGAIAHSRLFGACNYSAPVGDDEGQWPELEDLAERLQGKLLLMATMKDYIPVANTLRIVKALCEANKRFDMLLLPHLGHTVSVLGYPKLRAWDYLVEHLLGEEPPKNLNCGL